MKRSISVLIALAMCFTFVLIYSSVVMAGRGGGYMGGGGSVVVEEVPGETDDGDTGGIPDTVEGPLNDKMSDAGKLYGDLYVILRQQGVEGDTKLVPVVNEVGEAVLTDGVQLFVVAENDTDTPDAVVGGEPVLTVIDPPGNIDDLSDYGWYAAEIGVNPDETPIYGVAQSPYPAQCVQPVASYERWGDISSKTYLTKNRLPLIITYDPTFGRSECEVGQLVGEPTVDQATGDLKVVVNDYFIEPCFDKDGKAIADADCTWEDSTNSVVSYPYGVLWTELIGEVHFGRLNLSRSPEAVLQSSFDEAINTINSPDTVAIEIDAAGRLLLTKNVYEELLVDPETGLPLLADPPTIKKAIDSPLENVALYVKLMRDGHLVTPGNERMPLDRSKNGGIPLWKLLELSDGPADAALRPTIDIAKLRRWGLGSLVDVSEVRYLTYYKCLDEGGGEVACLIMDEDPVQPEYDEKLVGNPAAVSRIIATEDITGESGTVEDLCPVSSYEGSPYVCQGPFVGIPFFDGRTPDGDDLNFTASLLAAAGDKTGDISVDMVVYLNSILGINKVVGYSSYDTDGNPVSGAINYEEHPVYFDYRVADTYSRAGTFGSRGNVAVPGTGVADPQTGFGPASTYDGYVTVLQGGTPNWTETNMPILTSGAAPWKYVFWGMDGTTLVNTPGVNNILGFTQQADDNLSVIEFIHTYQIPGLR